MNIVDMADSPSYNPETNQNRGNWSLHDVTSKQVFLNTHWNKPDCIQHGAMNCVSPERTIWRCLTCSRACFDLDSLYL